MKTQHTPTPWHYSTGNDDCAIFTDGKEERGETIATLYAHNRGGEVIDYDYQTRDANAAFIVKAVNNHEALVAYGEQAVKKFNELMGQCFPADRLALTKAMDAIANLNAALAAAKGDV